MKPFNDILVTTYIDYLKGDDDREINHHGASVSVGGDEGSKTKEKKTFQVTPLLKRANHQFPGKSNI